MNARGFLLTRCAQSFVNPRNVDLNGSNPNMTDGKLDVEQATHFKYDAVPGTKDLGYTVEDCKGLASNDPENAVWNAANYEHFSGDRNGGLWEAEPLAYEDDESDARVEDTAQEVLASTRFTRSLDGRKAEPEY